jgi:hypothetical protein
MGARAASAAPGNCDGTVVDNVWTGARTDFGSVATDRYAFIAYYDAKRQLTVARVDLSSCAVERKQLSSVFTGWDSHNFTAIALDTNLRLHVSGNMHAVPLVYFRAQKPLDVASLEAAQMTGSDEDSVTYPSFLNAQGSLAFLYRQGGAGKGFWLLDEWTQDHWVRITNQELFSSVGQGKERAVSAYPTAFVPGPDGVYRVAVVWRGHGHGIETNFRLSYAQTRDFVHWTTHDGRPIALPLGPESMETVDDVGPNNGLVNNEALSVSPEGLPYISYTKYAPSGRNGAFVASPTTSGWQIRAVAEATQRTEVQGRGTLTNLAHVTAVQFGPTPSLGVTFNLEPARTVTPSGAAVAADSAAESPAHRLVATYPALAQEWNLLKAPVSRLSIPDAPVGGKAGEKGAIAFAWVTNRPNPGDNEPECAAGPINPCEPAPSPLIVTTRKY